MGTLGSSVTRSKKRTYVLVCVLFCCILSAGCSHPRGAWVYRASSYPTATEAVIKQTIVVLPFKDSRPTENTSKFFGMPMLLIPLIPYGWADYSRPESPQTVKLQDVMEQEINGPVIGQAINPWQFRPEKDFAEATVEELNWSRLFKGVAFSEQATDGDLILRGELKSTRYRAKAYTYGLGPLGWFPIMLGAPIGSVSNELDVEFVLEERVTGTQRWHKSYHETKDATFFLYWSPPDFYYDELFNRILQDVVKSLQAELTPRLSSPTQGGSAVPMRPSSD